MEKNTKSWLESVSKEDQRKPRARRQGAQEHDQQDQGEPLAPDPGIVVTAASGFEAPQDTKNPDTEAWATRTGGATEALQQGADAVSTHVSQCSLTREVTP